MGCNHLSLPLIPDSGSTLLISIPDCDDENCYNCSEDAYRCDECNEGYYPTPHGCAKVFSCHKTVRFCKECEERNDTLCLLHSCMDGYENKHGKCERGTVTCWITLGGFVILNICIMPVFISVKGNVILTEISSLVAPEVVKMKTLPFQCCRKLDYRWMIIWLIWII